MNKQQGVTLIELIIVVVIVSILAAIAIPGYGAHVKKTRRAMAAACLQENAQYMERWYTSKLTYVGAEAQPCTSEIQPFYDVDVDPTGARTFSATAVPKGAQEDDKCGTLSLNETGHRESSELTADACW
ncbi:MAG TPA: type IV pilin protein [Steroidobacteraceae bacterium]|nr:type IV pilin protein [Steroidobacteraceae bacterium]